MGVVRKVITAGSGVKPATGNTITVHCTGYLAEGQKEFWSSRSTNEPFSFRVGLGQVIRGWDEGLMQMTLGETAQLTISADYAYGDLGFSSWGVPPNATLIFEIELLKIDP